MLATPKSLTVYSFMTKRTRRGKKAKSNFTITVLLVLASFFYILAYQATDGDFLKISQIMAERDIQELVDNDNKYAAATSAFSLYHEYKENQIAANKRYENKRIGVTGRVNKVKLDAYGNAVVVLNVAFTHNGKVLAQGGAGFATKSEGLRRWQRTILFCTGGGMVDNLPVLNSCEIHLV